ncbi:MAG: FecR family protein [Chitinophagaceae bacterium]|jgi:ferric-dicitrate binding protein FerR (iron transport regulator)|nr:FecR family protein [Candidatus Methylopumilus sp.]MCF8286422.1 FecR family protein [Chitinophagaceae bacterium]MCF8289257.1 FecR family protein [Chitinophagaceae bacterium]MCF8422628.1 FecR family protein [Chitinophagaceae bacterium]
MNKQTEQYFFDLLSLKLSGDATESQLAEISTMLKVNPSLQFLYDQMIEPVYCEKEAASKADQAYATHYVKMQLAGMFDSANNQNLEPELEKPTGFSKRKLAFIGIAAGIFTIFFINYSLRLDKSVTKQTNNAFVNEVVTKRGSKSSIKLPDGTIVRLNTDSRLTYLNFTAGKNREVTLIGEAYFDVAHDSSRPFIIHTGKINIKVLGTSFNVRNYPQDKELETSLIKGKIEVSLESRPEDIITLKPTEKLIIAKEQDELATATKVKSSIDNKVVLTSITYLRHDSLVAETSWLNDKMVFVNQPLDKIAIELERKYAITVSFKDEKVKKYRYTGVFENVSLEKVFQLIKYSKNINYKIDDKNIVIE